MQVDRRTVLLGASAALLGACSGGAVTTPSRETQMKAVPNAGYDKWVVSFRARAAGKGISQSTLDQAFRGAGYLPDVIERDRNQTEFTRTLQDYLAIAASDDRISTGKTMLSRHSATLSKIEATYRVEPKIVTAIWGLESRYGARRGNVPVVSALSTLAYDGRRGEFFESQLIAALRILQNGDTSASNMTGSWAGAMGHTQFIPTSYLAYAVDFTGDGRRDIWSEDPTDALASAAAYLKRSGWTHGQPWGVEVRLPAGFNTGLAGRGSTRSTASWASMGVRDARGGTVPDYGAASVILPAGASGPAFMTFRNFTVITRYNNSEKYVIGVGHLADRIAGGPAIKGTFPPDAQGLTLADRKELQSRLTRAGYDTEGADGVIGSKSISAIKAYQAANGLTVDGIASAGLLKHLRS